MTNKKERAKTGGAIKIEDAMWQKDQSIIQKLTLGESMNGNRSL